MLAPASAAVSSVANDEDTNTNASSAELIRFKQDAAKKAACLEIDKDDCKSNCSISSISSDSINGSNMGDFVETVTASVAKVVAKAQSLEGRNSNNLNNNHGDNLNNNNNNNSKDGKIDTAKRAGKKVNQD